MTGVMRRFMIWVLPTDITGLMGTRGMRHVGGTGFGEDNTKTDLKETGKVGTGLMWLRIGTSAFR
jgi:hypothetical protein